MEKVTFITHIQRSLIHISKSLEFDCLAHNLNLHQHFYWRFSDPESSIDLAYIGHDYL